jgi:GxxExxY protein
LRYITKWDVYSTRQALAGRVRGTRLEVPVQVCFEDFSKTYYLDVLVGDGALFEFKTADCFVDRHRSQLLNYLLMTEIGHGKLVNLRGEKVEHEFVNATLTREERTSFSVDDHDYQRTGAGMRDLRDLLIAILRDWGTCLDVVLYEEAVAHFLGGQPQMDHRVDVRIAGKTLGQQRLNLLSPETSFCISVLNDGRDRYENQLRRFLTHTSLRAIQWANIGRKLVTFKTVCR